MNFGERVVTVLDEGIKTRPKDLENSLLKVFLDVKSNWSSWQAGLPKSRPSASEQ